MQATALLAPTQASPAWCKDVPQMVLDTLSTPAMLCTADGTIAWGNASLHAGFGVSSRQLMGSTVSEWLAPGEPLVDMIAQVARNPGQPLKLDVFSARIMASSDVQSGFQAVLTGTENASCPVLLELLNHAPALRVQAAANRDAQQVAQRELLRNLAHEIRNPLGGIRGAAQLLARASKDASSKEYTDVIVAETSRLQALLDRLLSAQAAPHTRSHVNAHEVFERVRSVVAAEYPLGLRWQRDYDISLPDVWADEHQLVQVFLNLVRNAAQILMLEPSEGSPLKGPPRITLRSRIVRQVTLGVHRHKLALELLVIDNGPGIPAAIKPHLFSPLVSHRVGGTGLGLHIAHSFVQQHGGTIEADSGHDGTVFRVVLPLVQ